jgi:hypothetical protein
MGENLAGMLDQDAKQLILRGRQLYVPSSSFNDMPRKVYGEITGAKHGLLTLDL